jgi:hypothetical protein
VSAGVTDCARVVGDMPAAEMASAVNKSSTRVERFIYSAILPGVETEPRREIPMDLKSTGVHGSMTVIRCVAEFLRLHRMRRGW